MTDNSIRFYDDLLAENIKLNQALKSSKDEKEQKDLEKQLNVVNNLIKYIYKYNSFRVVKIEDMKPTKTKKEKNNVTF